MNPGVGTGPTGHRTWVGRRAGISTQRLTDVTARNYAGIKVKSMRSWIHSETSRLRHFYTAPD
jgi:hypothetical protein